MFCWQYAESNEGMLHPLRRPVGNPHGRKARYCKEVAAFDIETTTVWDDEHKPHSFMYIWMFAIDGRTYSGRTWDELRDFLRIIEKKIPEGHTLLCYVHNLSYEYQFLSGQFPIPLESIFATEPRRILKVQLAPFLELRCSYFLTNMTLKKFLQTEGVPTQKEEMDYKKKRFPWTPLTEAELSYCEADVKGLCEAVRSRAERSGDTWYTIPYTSTGYVRREAKQVMRAETRHDGYKYDSWEVYKMLIKAFRGGNTHASRYWAALGPVYEKVISMDFSSEYPTVICAYEFPSREFFVEPPELLQGDSIAHLEDLIRQHYAVLCRVEFIDIHVSDAQHVPYIPVDKCEECVGAGIDNGRILDAGRIVTVVTDLDYKVIRSMYTWRTARVTWLAYSQYAPLPKGYVALAREYYRRKTSMKGVDDYAYRRSKELLNALYGMMAQAVLRMEITMDEDGVLQETPPEDMEGQYYKNAKKCFMPYSWGVWLTAHARADLLQPAIDAVGDAFIYCDTDSVKYLASGTDVDLGAMFPGDSFEAEDPKGNKHRMGIMEHDATYTEFVTLGAKKYAVRYPDGKLEITVAGVGKVDGSKELEAAGGLTAFRPGFIFKSGGVDAVYNDTDDFVYKGKIRITRNVSLIEGEYTLGLSDTYSMLLDSLANDRRVIDPFSIN